MNELLAREARVDVSATLREVRQVNSLCQSRGVIVNRVEYQTLRLHLARQ